MGICYQSNSENKNKNISTKQGENILGTSPNPKYSEIKRVRSTK